MGIPAIKSDHKYTYSDYCQWPDDERWELINGVAYNMSPAPGTRHQEISFFLSTEIGIFLKGKSCKAFSAPFDVFLSEMKNQDISNFNTIVQPDISVICNSDKIVSRGCIGAPDLIMEILSPSTSSKDLNIKYKLYEKSGVPEYWIVDPGNEYIRIFHLTKEGKYDYGTLFSMYDLKGKDTTVPSVILNGFQVNLADLFPG